MRNFQNKVAVITGAASGIGRGLAEYCLQKKMKLVMADIEDQALTQAARELGLKGGEIVPVVADVSNVDEVKGLVQKTTESFGQVDLLFNNAGVAAGAALWECTLNDCQWVIGVNLWGVIHCIREFVPVMLKQDSPCHIVNTSSMAGLSSYHPSALYQLTKHGIVALSEQLHHDLALRKTRIKVSVLCPGFVRTNIMDAERNRPQKFRNHLHENDAGCGPDPEEQMFRQMIENGMPPSEVAERVFQALESDEFYIFPHPELKFLMEKRMADLLENRNPSLPQAPG